MPRPVFAGMQFNFLATLGRWLLKDIVGTMKKKTSFMNWQ